MKLAKKTDEESGLIRKYVTTIGDGTLTNFTVTHNLNTRDISVSVIKNAAPYNSVQVGWSAATLNTITLSTASPCANAELKVIIIG